MFPVLKESLVPFLPLKNKNPHQIPADWAIHTTFPVQIGLHWTLEKLFLMLHVLSALEEAFWQRSEALPPVCAVLPLVEPTVMWGCCISANCR